MHVQPRLVAVYRLLKEGSTGRARAACRRVLRETPEDATATHLLGLIYKTDGDVESAERFLRKSIELEPAAAGFRANLGDFLRQTGQLQEAERTYREALALDPGFKHARVGLVRTLLDLEQAAAAEREARELARHFESDPESWSLVAATIREQGRIAEAEALYRKTLALAPGNAAAHHELGAVWSRMDRPEEALEAFQRAQKLGTSGACLSLELGRVYLQMYRFEEAERAFAEAVRAAPRDPDAQLQLARARFMAGDPAFARDLVATAGSTDNDPCLGARFGILLRQVGLPGEAEHHFQMLLHRHGRTPEVLAALARLQLETGRPGKARGHVLDALRAKPEDAAIAETAVAVLLACGEPELASWYVAKHRKCRPLDQGWIANEAVIARLLDPDRYRELYDFERLVRVYEPEAPAGWTSMSELNEALREALGCRHRSPTLPVDDSLRHGSRTTRSLLTDPDAVIQAVLKSFEAPLADYCRALGTDAGHPVSARNTGEARLAEAWSVQLGRHGHHVNHVHCAGWISSAYYVTTPDEVDDADRMPGWIRFGEPRFAVPGANAERFIKPAPARLVLFPACMWHGTSAIEGPGPRTTISFDAVPAGTPGSSYSR